MLTIADPSGMWGTAARQTRAVPATLTSHTEATSASLRSSRGVCRTIPAQLTTAEMEPSFAAPAIAVSTLSADRISSGAKTTAPSARSAATDMSPPYTVKPARVRLAQMACPMPPAAPVTNATSVTLSPFEPSRARPSAHRARAQLRCAGRGHVAEGGHELHDLARDDAGGFAGPRVGKPSVERAQAARDVHRDPVRGGPSAQRVHRLAQRGQGAHRGLPPVGGGHAADRLSLQVRGRIVAQFLQVVHRVLDQSGDAAVVAGGA